MGKLLVIVVLGVLSAGVRAEVFDSINYSYYEADGSPDAKRSLKQRLDAATPIKRDGVVLHGDTRWSISWKLITDNATKGLCKIKEARVYLNALIQLPEMHSDSDTLQKQFNSYVAALQRHHIAHYVVGVQAANKIDLRLSQLEPQSNCKALNTSADEVANGILNHYRQQDKTLDEMTEYGAKQGARLTGH